MKTPTIRYRLPADLDGPTPGAIVMSAGSRTRRPYRVISAVPSTMTGGAERTWKLSVETMSAEQGRAEIAAGFARWTIEWDKRDRRAR